MYAVSQLASFLVPAPVPLDGVLYMPSLYIRLPNATTFIEVSVPLKTNAFPVP